MMFLNGEEGFIEKNKQKALNTPKLVEPELYGVPQDWFDSFDSRL